VKKFLMSLWVVVVGALVCSAYVSAHSEKTKMKASLDGAQEVPLVVTTGTGTLDLEIDDDAQVIDFTLSYQGLEGVAPTTPGGVVTASHIHIGLPGTNGGVSVFFCGGGGKPACPPQPATVTGTITPADVLGPANQGVTAGEFADLINTLRDRSTYVNVHTTRSPGGEIRGLIK
jgi:hypothetical protein